MSLAELDRLSRELEACRSERMKALKAGDMPKYQELLFLGVDLNSQIRRIESQDVESISFQVAPTTGQTIATATILPAPLGTPVHNGQPKS